MDKVIEPKFDILLIDYTYLGRGPDATGIEKGWQRDESIYMRCVVCGDIMPSIIEADYSCECGSMFVDYHYNRFGSTHGDLNIMVYCKVET